MVSPVQFTKAVSVILPEKSGRAVRSMRNHFTVDCILELGPHGALQGPLRQILQKNGHADSVTYASTISRGKDAVRTTVEAMGLLWMRGQPVALARMNIPNAGIGSARVLSDLPNYPWK